MELLRKFVRGDWSKAEEGAQAPVPPSWEEMDLSSKVLEVVADLWSKLGDDYAGIWVCFSSPSSLLLSIHDLERSLSLTVERSLSLTQHLAAEVQLEVVADLLRKLGDDYAGIWVFPSSLLLSIPKKVLEPYLLRKLGDDYAGIWVCFSSPSSLLLLLYYTQA